MTVAVLTRTLDEELEALLAGETGECLVCGEDVDVEGKRAECPCCGSVLELLPGAGPDQLALV